MLQMLAERELRRLSPCSRNCPRVLDVSDEMSRHLVQTSCVVNVLPSLQGPEVHTGSAAEHL